MDTNSYQGKLLVAHPNNPQDELQKGVLLVIGHDKQGSLALQINYPVLNITLARIAYTMDITYEGDDVIYYGGSSGQTKVHVLHTRDWQGITTSAITDDIAMTSDLSVIMAISRNRGPKHFKACAGYQRWDTGDLDKELNTNDTESTRPHRWELAPATTKTVFFTPDADIWNQALEDSARHQISAWF